MHAGLPPIEANTCLGLYSLNKSASARTPMLATLSTSIQNSITVCLWLGGRLRYDKKVTGGCHLHSPGLTTNLKLSD